MKTRSKAIFNIFTLFALLISLIGSAVTVTPAYAATLAVNSFLDEVDDNLLDGVCHTASNTCTLRAAIQEANALAGADTITVPAGTYTLTIAGTGEDAAATGDLDLTSNITINGAAGTIIDGGALDSVFQVTGAFTVNISGVTIKNGKAASNGGGIFNNTGPLTVTNSTFSGNSATASGGGIFNGGGTVTVTNSTFSNNSAGGGGGGIYNSTGTLTVTNSTFSGNLAPGAGNNGGGITNLGVGTLTVTNSTFSNNSSGGFGGGISNYGSLTITNSTFNTNTAITGGGINNEVSTLTATNNTFSGNSATTGGGIRNAAGGTATLINTIIANSTTGGNCSNAATLNVSTDSMADDATCGSATQKTLAQINLGPLTGSPAYFPLNLTSAAIDAGTNTGCPTTSRNGVARPVGGICDIGSYELGFTVTFNANTGIGTMTPQTENAPTALKSNTFTKIGYIFANWNTAADDSGTVYANGASYPFTANNTLYARWVADIVSTPIFTDVPFTHWANNYIELLYKYGVTSGCSTTPMTYCPDTSATRAEMAIFILRTKHNMPVFVFYMPPLATGKVFADVPLGSFADAWIEQLAKEGITNGCGGGNYCPNAAITRAEMAIFLLRGRYGSTYNPPAATGTVFSDVPLGSFAAAWIEQLKKEGITVGCLDGKSFCPGSSVTRAEMAPFLVKTFGLQ